MRGLLVLFIAPAVFGQGNVTVTAGALSCGAVMRGVDQIQTYCYAPGLKLVHNTLNTVATQMFVDYSWCVEKSGCTFSEITWVFRLNPNGGINWQYTINGDSRTIKSGTFTGIFGTSGANCPPFTVPSSRVALNAQGNKVPVSFWHRGTEVCASWIERGASGWSPVSQCGMVNMFQLCAP